jgi:hypothetical protein
VDEAGSVLRQIMVFENGSVLKYDAKTAEIENEELFNGPIDLEQLMPFTISADEFHDRWRFPIGRVSKHVHGDGRVSWEPQ